MLGQGFLEVASVHIKKDSIRRIKFINLSLSEFDSNCRTFFFFQRVSFSDFMGNEQHLSVTGPTFSDMISFSGLFSFCFFVHISQQIQKGVAGNNIEHILTVRDSNLFRLFHV
jgi:hypothetical protein